MIYILLNAFVFVAFVLFTSIIDRRFKSDNHDTNFFSLALLIETVHAFVFTFVLLLAYFGNNKLTGVLLKLCYILDGFFIVTMSTGLLGLGLPKKNRVVKYLQYLLYIAVIVLVFSQFNEMDISFEDGIIVDANYLFDGATLQFFDWTWFDFYTVVFKVFLPITCFIWLMVMQEGKAAELENYQNILMGSGFLLYWFTIIAVNTVAYEIPVYGTLMIFPSLFLSLIFYTAFQKNSVPSGRGIVFSVLKILLSYLIPAVFVSAYCYYMQPENSNFNKLFFGGIIILTIILVNFSLKISSVLSSSTKIYAADYENSLEKALAAIDYTDAEMEQITNQMYDIFRRNVESSALNVYILSNQTDLITAYSSNKLDLTLPINNAVFDTLLNMNTSIVAYSQIEQRHEYLQIQKELKDFFALTKSDCIILLNEGHNVFGLLTLGKKVSGDHFKDYDTNVFERLYSYFFVFGYFMRNIANKDIIGIVNREIRMSSQIITSIQENIDRIKNPKIDTGYLMVPAHNIGGEFIDFIRLTATKHLFVVGDLSGKGIAASMNMVILKSIIRTFLAETHDFKDLVVRINSFIRNSLRKGTMFAGLFALVDFETDTLYYINCGIPTLMMYTQVYNNVIEIQGTGYVLGFVQDISPYISVKSTKLNRGDIILACTNGLLSSRSLRGEQFGKERVQLSLLDNSTYPAQRMTQFTFDNLKKFMSKEMEDDVSILILKYEAESVNSPEKIPQEFETYKEDIDIPEVTEKVENDIVVENVIEENGTDTEESEKEPVEIKEEPKSEPAPVKLSAGEPPEGFDMSELDDLDSLLNDVGL